MKVIATLTGEDKKTVDDLFENQDSAQHGAFDLSKKAKAFGTAAWKTIKEIFPDADNKKQQLKYNRETGEVTVLYWEDFKDLKP